MKQSSSTGYNGFLIFLDGKPLLGKLLEERQGIQIPPLKIIVSEDFSKVNFMYFLKNAAT